MAVLLDARRFFTERYGLSEAALERVLGTAVGRRADYADCYFEFRVTQTASLEDGVVKKATRSIQQGVGVRVLAGARTGYAYSDEVTLERLELAARTAQHIADRSAAPAVAALAPARVPHDLYPVVPPPIETPLADAVALLARIDAAARAVSPAVTNVIAGIGIELLRAAMTCSSRCVPSISASTPSALSSASRCRSARR